MIRLDQQTMNRSKVRAAGSPPKESKSDVVKECATKAMQTAELLQGDLLEAYKAADDPVVQLALRRLMEQAAKLQSEVVEFQAAIVDRN
jgi:hypothetical protein